MKQKIKLLFFIKITLFIYLNWICHFIIDVSVLNKSPYKKNDNGGKLSIRTYRLLTKRKQDRYLHFMRLNEKMQNNEEYEKKDITNNENGVKRINRTSYKNSLNTDDEYKHYKRDKSYIFETKKYSYLEKKIFKDLDFFNFLKNNKTISDKTYKKVILKKCGLRFSLPLLLLILLLVSLAIGRFWNSGLIKGAFSVVTNIYGDENWISHFGSWLKSTSPFSELFKVMKDQKVVHKFVTNFFGYLIYVVPIILLGFIFILAVVYYHKKVKKYERIKFRKRLNV
ncbi:hypothetical protein MKS88_001736 [Plasmodium brasilianum]|uniref:Uncharacterized protein n=1 Tax=Plasmodium brasilianum TaxID=5824 RepID=A0ACB9YC96_PLABR|nr:hypothetical protein MKS88_001736 [Plasmodium brasilianum]